MNEEQAKAQLKIPEELEGVISEKDNWFDVNWEALEDSRFDCSKGRGYYSRINSELIEFLREKKFLIPGEPTGAYAVYGTGVNIGPLISGRIFSFSREEDARKYKNTRWKNATFGIKVHLII
ncbi:MAG: hypothetical protein ABIG37_03070 [Nanoarchaeota archaeon]|nr:hypothetical protein [Nanoarchaeota archaeon]